MPDMTISAKLQAVTLIDLESKKAPLQMCVDKTAYKILSTFIETLKITEKTEQP